MGFAQRPLPQKMSSVVCDASVLFKTLVSEEDSDRADTLLETFDVTIPDLAYAEIGNALWARVRKGDISVEKAQDLISRLTLSIFDVRPIQPLISRALAIATAMNHPVYDCVYLALAERLNVPLVTGDIRFIRAAKR